MVSKDLKFFEPFREIFAVEDFEGWRVFALRLPGSLRTLFMLNILAYAFFFGFVCLRGLSI